MHAVAVGSLMLAGGIVLLVAGGNALVRSAVAIATRLGAPPLLIGLTIVAWGTSAPELAFNTTAALRGQTGMVFGNVVGANIANIGLILGIGAILRPLPVASRVVHRELPIMLVILGLMAALGLLVGDPGRPSFTRLEGAVLLVAFGLYTAFSLTVGREKRHQRDELALQTEQRTEPTARAVPMWRAWFLMALGIVLLGLGGAVAATGATRLATGLGVPQAIVALTVVAVGTTLPELIASVIAIRRGEVDLAIGNVIGSCIFNAGAIFGLGMVLAPGPAPTAGVIPLAAMVGFALALVPISRTFHGRIARWEGVLLLVAYAAYLTYLTVEATRGGPS